ncbi:MAG TPA: hypothetical protein VLF88_02245 [Candidatus Babeliales bacterium]|nr:hypothetical protein [Candidatus Babeliales bacterium]
MSRKHGALLIAALAVMALATTASGSNAAPASAKIKCESTRTQIRITICGPTIVDPTTTTPFSVRVSYPRGKPISKIVINIGPSDYVVTPASAQGHTTYDQSYKIQAVTWTVKHFRAGTGITKRLGFQFPPENTYGSSLFVHVGAYGPYYKAGLMRFVTYRQVQGG